MWGHLGLESYPPEHLCDGLCSLVADVVSFKVELFDGGDFLPEIERKDTVSGGAANSAQNASKVFVGGGSSVWVPIFRIQRQRRN